MSGRRFPDGFLWGVATSAQQIEGAHAADGRSESIWDRFAAQTGKTADGTDPKVACDHYNRWREDIELLRNLGVNSYRFSIAWPRVIPGGRGEINKAGLDFYDALVDALLRSGITPFATLYHWDLPQALQDEGGWSASATAEAFVEYADAVTKRLGDRVKHWTTHNEPWCIAILGYEQGDHAPGHRNPAEALRAAHHLLLSHGWATDVIRRNSPGAETGIVLNLVPVEPASPGEADADAARRLDGTFNRWFLDPLFHGVYPDDVVVDRAALRHLRGTDLPFVRDGDLKSINTRLDYLGINYYSRAVVRAGENGSPARVPMVPDKELTDMGWEVYPQGLDDLLRRVHRDYAPPKVYVTENGVAYSDGPDAGGRIPDARRIAFLRGHLLAAHRAIGDGVPLRGYFTWSFMDNFEWGHGYTKRFGLYWVDFETQRRVAKDSAAWYRDVVTSNALSDGAPESN